MMSGAVLPPLFQILTGLSFLAILVLRFAAPRALKPVWCRVVGFSLMFVSLGHFLLSHAAAKSLVRPDHHALVRTQPAELVGLQPVNLLLDVAALGAALAKGARDRLPKPFAEEVRRVLGIGFGGRLEDEPVAQIQAEHLRLVAVQWRDEGLEQRFLNPNLRISAARAEVSIAILPVLLW